MCGKGIANGACLHLVSRMDDPNANLMNIVAKTITGGRFTLAVSRNDVVIEVKAKLEGKDARFKARKTCLLFQGVELHNNTLCFMCLKDGDTVQAVLARAPPPPTS